MRFCDIIGQETEKHQLRPAVQEGRIPHAQLFAGPAGVGKLALALAYAQYVACPHRTDKDSCGTCPTCLQFHK
ncbi:MAG: DNA polymerase III subunit delta, partial [Paludibacteraceae bacterium]|nr:DNA polymerase III subunit delta [Paludibacteraceae bacterium]